MDNALQIVLALTALCNVAAAILAWVAKLRWSEEFREAKQAQIDALQAQVTTYKELGSSVLRDHFVTTKQGLEEVITQLKNEKGVAVAALQEKDSQLTTLQSNEATRQAAIEKLRLERDSLQEAIDAASGLSLEGPPPGHDPAVWADRITTSASDLTKSIQVNSPALDAVYRGFTWKEGYGRTLRIGRDILGKPEGSEE